jgi:WD40 repeat protein
LLLSLLAAVLITGAIVAQPPGRVDLFGEPLPDGAVSRLGSTLLSPGQTIQAMEFSPDGKRLAYWTWGGPEPGGRLRIVDTSSGRELRHEYRPYRLVQMRWLADGRGLAVVKLTKKDFYVWEFTDEKVQPPHREKFENVGFEGDPKSVSISPDGRWLAVDSSRFDAGPRPIELRAVVANTPLEQLNAKQLDVGSGHVTLMFSPDGRRLFVLRRERLAGAPRPNAAGPAGVVGPLAGGATVTVYEVASQQKVTSFRVAGSLTETAGVDAPRWALSPDGKTLYVGDENGVVHVYDWAAGRELWSVEPHAPADRKSHEVPGIRSLVVSADGRTLFSVGPSFAVTSVDLTAEKPAARRCDPAWRVEQVVASPDGTRIAFAGSDVSGRITFLDAKTGADLLPRPGHSSMINSVAAATDGTVVTVAGIERTVCWWDAERGRELRRKRIDRNGNLLYAALTADGRGLFRVSAGDIEFIDLASGHASKVAAGPLKPYAAVLGVTGTTAFHTTADGKVRAWDAASGRVGPALESAGISLWGNPASQSPDGKTVVLLGAEFIQQQQRGFFNCTQVMFYDAGSGALKRHWQSREARFESAAWSGDGRYLLVAGQSMPGRESDGLAHPLPIPIPAALVLFDALTTEPLRTFQPVARTQHGPLNVTAVTFSPSGNYFAIGQNDGSVHVYEFATGLPARSFQGHRAHVSQLLFTANGRRLISVSHDTTGLVWDTSLANLAKPIEIDSDAKRERAWEHLAVPDWELAGPALAALAGRPNDLAALVRSRLKPAEKPAVDAEAIAKLVAQLDDQVVAVRERAAAALGRLGREALPLLHEQLPKAASAEARKRLYTAIRDISSSAEPSERLRETRVVALLEQANTEATQAELKRLADGHADAALTRDAAAALKRVTP